MMFGMSVFMFWNMINHKTQTAVCIFKELSLWNGACFRGHPWFWKNSVSAMFSRPFIFSYFHVIFFLQYQILSTSRVLWNLLWSWWDTKHAECDTDCFRTVKLTEKSGLKC
jgi:hypothetical protein